MQQRWITLTVFGFGIFLASAHVSGLVAQQKPDLRVADLVRAGKVRVAVYLPNYNKDPATGELRRWTIDLARALGARIGVEAVPVEHQTPPQAITCLKTEDCDVALLGFDPARLVDVDYSPAIIELDYTFLVPADSTIHGLADLDRPGMRVAVVRNHASTMTLTRMLKQATFSARQATRQR